MVKRSVEAGFVLTSVLVKAPLGPGDEWADRLMCTACSRRLPLAIERSDARL